MSRQTVSSALPESMRKYIGDLVRRDQEDQAKKRLRDIIQERLATARGEID